MFSYVAGFRAQTNLGAVQAGRRTPLEFAGKLKRDRDHGIRDVYFTDHHGEKLRVRSGCTGRQRPQDRGHR